MPAVSVIIPLYNAEKYIGECLDSILAQTFQDFEVIVVDDCSTDNSAVVVKSYAEKFNGRLKLTRTLKNSGNPGVPGNMGVRLSRGEYLLILDNDDAITADALEKLYSTARAFDADVVACEKYFGIPSKVFGDLEFLANAEPYSYQTGDFVDEPTLIDDDLSKRVADCVQKRFLWNLWTKLIRRDFVIQNELYFTGNLMQDMIFTCCLVVTAKKFVRVPYVVNRYRLADDSLSHRKDTLEVYLRKCLQALRTGFEYLNNFFDARETFRQQNVLKTAMMNVFLAECMTYLANIYGEVPEHLIEETLRRELASENFSPALTAAILGKANYFRFRFDRAQNRIAELEKSARQDKAYIAELEKFTAQLLNKE